MDDRSAARRQSAVRRFGIFEFDAQALELRKAGHLVAVRPQALKLLGLLLARAGEVVPRVDLEHVLWSASDFVDQEQGVNHAIGELRAALGDAADSPRFIQTLQRRGYRFIAPVRPEPVADGASRAPRAREAARSVDHTGWLTAVVGAGVLAGAWLLWHQRFGRNRILRALSR